MQISTTTAHRGRLKKKTQSDLAVLNREVSILLSCSAFSIFLFSQIDECCEQIIFCFYLQHIICVYFNVHTWVDFIKMDIHLYFIFSIELYEDSTADMNWRAERL